MDLIARIESAFSNRPLNAQVFEDCACALLVSKYPGLSQVEGGHDFGRDADIYFPTFESDTTGRGRLLATIGDPAANLRTSLKRMKEEGLAADLVVVAAARPISATQRQTLTRICASYGIPEPHVYGRKWFIGRLVDEPEWRERLLGVRGRIATLTDFPLASLSQATDEPTFVGRSREASTADDLLARMGDFLVVGVPGVGKTRLVMELGSGVMFLQRSDSGDLVDDLLRTRPRAVVIDDAHTRAEDIQALRLARHQEGLTFSLVATTWPDRADLVKDMVPDADTLVLDPLSRVEIDALIRSVGVTGYRARAAVIQQAAGRPGWALSFCDLFVDGRGADVQTGAALVAHVESYLRRATESEEALDVLACVAALGGLASADTQLLARAVAMPLASLVSLMERAARNGLLDYRSGVWMLQPALRAPLIARWFFGDRPGRELPSLMSEFPNQAHQFVSATVAAADIGSHRAMQAVESWIAALPSELEWDAATLDLVGEFAGVSESAGKFAVPKALSVLANPRETTRFRDIVIDPLGDTAHAILVRAATQWLVPDAIAHLLDCAQSELGKPPGQQPALRELQDLAKHIDPDYGSSVEIRRRLFRVSMDWLKASPVQGRWLTVATVMRSVMGVESSGSWADPGAPRTVTLGMGTESPTHLSDVIDMWPEMDATFLTSGPAGAATCPPEALALVIDLAGDWLRLACGVGPGSTPPSPEQRAVGARGAALMFASLHPRVAGVPGLALRAQKQIDWASHTPLFPGDLVEDFVIEPDVEAFGGRREPGEDVHAWIQDRDRQVDEQAQAIAGLGPVAGVQRFLQLAKAANQAGGMGDSGFIAFRMRPFMQNPEDWYRASVAHGAGAILGQALSLCLQGSEDDLTADEIHSALDDPALRGTAVGAVAEATKVTPAAQVILDDLGLRDLWVVDSLSQKTEHDEVMDYLLHRAPPPFRWLTALSFALDDLPGPPLPHDWDADRRQLIEEMDLENLPHHTRWRAEEILKRMAVSDPDVFEAWFSRRIAEMRERGFYHSPEPHGVDEWLATLPEENRERLARQVAGLHSVGHGPFGLLLGRDPTLAAKLLDEGVLTTDDLLAALLEQRNDRLEALAPLLIRKGVPAAQIAAQAGWLSGWMGSEAEAHKGIESYFRELAERRPDLSAIADAGMKQQSLRVRAAEEAERREEIDGW